MKISKDGKIQIDIQEICDALSPEDRRAFLKQNVISPDVIKWVTDWLLEEDEDGWFGGNVHELREDLLRRAEEKQMKKVSIFNWTLLKKASDALAQFQIEKQLYYRIYHHSDKYNTTIDEFLGSQEVDEIHAYWRHKNKELEDKIQEIVDIVKNAVEKQND